MRRRLCAAAVLMLLAFCTTLGCCEPEAQKLPYQNPKLPIEERVEDLLKRMTLEEKVAQLGGDATGMSTPENARLGIPSYTMSDGPYGVRRGKATCFPPALGMAASWDEDLVTRVGEALGREFRARGRYVALGPCMNLIRDPRGGRSFETFGEDPYLVGRLAVSYVQGMQSEKCIATPKHYACNNQENGRGGLPVDIDERLLRELYLPHFETVIKESQAWAVMGAYNKVNGFYCCENKHLLRDILKDEWGFKGIVMTDWGACHSTVNSMLAGLDVEMPRANYYGQPLLDAVKRGEVPEALIDDAVRRVLRTKFWAGAFEQMPVADDSLINTPNHQALAREAAQKSCVLLKNDRGLLPLDKTRVTSIALFGPSAATPRPCGGGSSTVTPYYNVTPIDGLHNKLGPDFGITYMQGCPMEPWENTRTVPTEVLTPSKGQAGQTGLTAEFFATPDLKGDPILTRVDKTVDFDWKTGVPAEGVKADRFSIRWTGKITARQTGEHLLSLTTDDGCRLFLDNKQLINDWKDHAAETRTATVKLEAGRSYDLRIEYYENGGDAVAKFQWAEPNRPAGDFKDVRALAAASDIAIVCVGTSARQETEGRDRPHLALTGEQDALVKAVAASNRNTIVAVISGSAVLMDQWIDQVPAVVQAWFGGQEAGNALADVLFGDVNPSGKLAVTFPRSEDQLPPFDAHYETAGEGRGYRYYEKKDLQPLFPFGYGLSYTQYLYSNLEIEPRHLYKGEHVKVSVDVQNVGQRPGEEIVQFYVQDPVCSVDRPEKELKAFARVRLQPNEVKRITVDLGPRALAFYDVNTKDWVVEPGEFRVMVGASSQDLRAAGSFLVQ